MASKMKMMGSGGDMSQDKSMIKKAFKQHDMQEHKGGKGTALKLKNGGKVKRYADGSEDGVNNYEDESRASDLKKDDSATQLGSKRATIGEPYTTPLPDKKPEFNSFKEAYAYYKKPQNGGEGSTFDWQGKKILVKDDAKPTAAASSAKSTEVDTGMASRAVSKANSSSDSNETPSRKDTGLFNKIRERSGNLPPETPSKGNEQTKAKYESYRNAPSPLDNLKKVGSGISGVFKSIRERGESTAKMASGGMVKARQTVKSLGKAC